MLARTRRDLEAGRLQPKPPHENLATFAPLLEKNQGEIAWNKSAWEIHNQIRGLFPWPGASTLFLNQRVKILKSRIPTAQNTPQRALAAGEFMLFGASLFVGTGEGQIELLSLQPEGKRALLPEDFANGIRGKNPTLSVFKFGE